MSIFRVPARPFWSILEASWGGFWIYFQCFLIIDFALGFHLLLKCFFPDFHALWAGKNEQIAWEVLQKSKFRAVCYRMRLEMDFGWILGSDWRQFWIPSARQKGLRKQVL